MHRYTSIATAGALSLGLALGGYAAASAVGGAAPRSCLTDTGQYGSPANGAPSPRAALEALLRTAPPKLARRDWRATTRSRAQVVFTSGRDAVTVFRLGGRGWLTDSYAVCS